MYSDGISRRTGFLAQSHCVQRMGRIMHTLLDNKKYPFMEVSRKLPVFEVDSRNVTVLHEPAEFYDVLLVRQQQTSCDFRWVLIWVW